MKPHYIGEQKVNIEVVASSEDILNNYSRAWTRILGIGADAGDFMPQRVSNALMVNHSNVPFLDGLRKDHKAYHNETLGPPLRPLSNAKIGPYAPLENLLARILLTVRLGMSSNGYNTEILSTDE